MTDFVLAPKQAIAVIVMIAFIMVCVFAPFGAAHAIVGLSTAAVTILIAGLAAIGITFASTGSFDTLEEYVSSLLQDYASSQNIPVTSIFNGTQYGANAAGKLILNNRFVQLISGFANWLKIKYNLSNNSTVTIQNSGYNISGYAVYYLPVQMVSESGNSNMVWEAYISDPGVLCFWSYRSAGAETTSPLTNSPVPFFVAKSSAQVQRIKIQNGQSTVQATITLNYDSNKDLYWNYGTTSTGFPENQWQWETFEVYSYSELSGIWSALSATLSPSYDNGVSINTGVIDIPTDRTGYNDSDGAILDVSAPWSEPVSGVINTVPSSWDMVEDDTLVYTLDLEAEAVLEEQLPHPTDIENLPGATIPGLPDINGEPWHFEFSNLWHYVAQWISDMSAGGAVIWNTCIQAPPAIINFVFAGIVLAMWFGAIKILR